MTKRTIQIHFQKTVNQTNQLNQLASQLEKTANQILMSCINQIATDWKGDNATAYCNKGRAVANDLLSLAKELRYSSADINRVLKNHYDAELAALEIAKRRLR